MIDPEFREETDKLDLEQARSIAYGLLAASADAGVLLSDNGDRALLYEFLNLVQAHSGTYLEGVKP